MTYGLNGKRGHMFALQHHKYTDTASIYALPHIHNYANTPHGPNFPPKRELLQMAKAKCQCRRVPLTKLQTKLQTWQPFKNESQLFVCSSLQLIIVSPIAVPRDLLGPDCNSWKLKRVGRAGLMIDHCRHVVPLPCVMGVVIHCSCDSCFCWKAVQLIFL